MYEEEGKRLRMFIERVCKMSQLKFMDAVNKEIIRVNPAAKPYNPSQINKILSGKILTPFALLKAMRRLWKLNYEWVFDGVGELQTDGSNQRKMAHDVAEILATVMVLEDGFQSMKRNFNRLAADYYADKKGVKSN